MKSKINSYSRSEFLAETRIQVNTQMIGVNGRRLVPPRIAYKNMQIVSFSSTFRVR